MLNHIAFIMDGNGRWAKNINKNRSYGHKVGFENMLSIIDNLLEHEIKIASFYCFSTENWSRPIEEVNYLMSIIEKLYLDPKFITLINKGVRINVCGRRDRIPESTLKYVKKIEEESINNNKLICNIMFDYGSLNEIETMISNIVEKKLEINEKNIYSNLYVSDKIDLMIRTGGEYRLSNFMLLQIAYAELFFTKTYWPDFEKEELDNIIMEFNKRNRTFGEYKERENEN